MDGESQDENKVWSFVKKYWAVILVCILALVYLGFALVNIPKNERMDDQTILNQLAAENADPVYFKYTGRDKDVLGMSGEDYYYTNMTYANSRAANQLLEGNAAFVNQTDYLDMPPEYRPRPLSGFIGQSGNVVASEHGPEANV